MPTITSDRILSDYRKNKSKFAAFITAGIAGGLPVADIIEYIARLIMREIIAEAPALWAWLHDALQQAGEAFDARHTWTFIKNDRLRAFVEANDNPYDILQRGVQALSDEIEDDISTAKGSRLLSLVGGEDDEIASFFRGTRVRRSPLTPDPDAVVPADREPIPVESMAEASLLATNQRLSAEVDNLTAKIDSLTAELALYKIDITTAEEEGEEPIDLGAGAVTLPADPADLPIADAPSVPSGRSGRLMQTLQKRAQRPSDADRSKRGR